MDEQPSRKYLDLDAFVPSVEPATIKVNNTRYEVVKEISTGTFMRILKLGELQGEEASENLVAVFQEAIPDLPSEIIMGMTAPQLTGCLTFLIQMYMKDVNDPNLIRPMLKQKTRKRRG